MLSRLSQSALLCLSLSLSGCVMSEWDQRGYPQGRHDGYGYRQPAYPVERYPATRYHQQPVVEYRYYRQPAPVVIYRQESRHPHRSEHHREYRQVTPGYWAAPVWGGQYAREQERRYRAEQHHHREQGHWRQDRDDHHRDRDRDRDRDRGRGWETRRY